MKILKKIKTFILIAVTLVFFGCDLELQEGFTFFPEVSLEDPFNDITAWQFIQQIQRLDEEEGGFDGDSYQYLAAAIEAAGMVEEYNSSGADRTYLLLNNNAFTDEGDVIELITGSEEVGEGETPAQVMARADLDVLRLILRYHIIDSYVDQLTLTEFGVNYEFQTLIPGEDGKIILRRDERYRIDINRDPAPLPSSATSENERIRNYNYVFNNGIGHSLNDPVRNRPYPTPSP